MADLKLYAELKEKLKGLMPFSQAGVVEYTPPELLDRDLPEEMITVYTHRCFSQKENEEFNQLIKDGKVTNQTARDFARRVTKGWKNLYDLDSGKEIPYKADADGGCDKVLWDAVLDYAAGGICRNAGKWSGLYPPEVEGLKS